VPSPLKFLGRIPGKPGELTYAKDIHRYFEALAKASPRAKFWTIGQTEEGRDQVILAIADEATIKDLDKHKENLARLGDPRKITDEQARELIKTAKPLYWAASGIHSPEMGGPEMLIELAYAVHSVDPQQRNHVSHARYRGRWAREGGRHVLLQQEAAAGRHTPAADVLGQVRAT
jgi:hypothetical protein